VRAAAQLTVKSRTEIVEGPSDQEATVFTSLKVGKINFRPCLDTGTVQIY
jgi:hypothetical protein